MTLLFFCSYVEKETDTKSKDSSKIPAVFPSRDSVARENAKFQRLIVYKRKVNSPKIAFVFSA